MASQIADIPFEVESKQEKNNMGVKEKRVFGTHVKKEPIKKEKTIFLGSLKKF
jgi:hypothetical protein